MAAAADPFFGTLMADVSWAATAPPAQRGRRPFFAGAQAAAAVRRDVEFFRRLIAEAESQ